MKTKVTSKPKKMKPVETWAVKLSESRIVTMDFGTDKKIALSYAKYWGLPPGSVMRVRITEVPRD